MPERPSEPIRRRIHIQGAVQGVGFRPFVYRLADELRLAGWVSNTAQGVRIEVEGPPTEVEAFVRRVEQERPPLSRIYSFETWALDAHGYSGFEIVASDGSGAKSALVLPDIATCPECLRELFDPADRRFRYPFLNCTHCGPRYTIVRALPYDRPNTSMAGFPMCAECRREYEDPLDRRFHAQPVACPVCGPRLTAHRSDRSRIAEGDDALLFVCDRLRRGEIVAVKGIGGFHLMVDARDDHAVQRLRRLKQRESKPLAVLAPSQDFARTIAELGDAEERALCSPESPILLARRLGSEISPSVAPGNPNLGVMLPSNPLHHLLAAELGFPVVATSGNLSDEPICIDNDEAFDRLGGIADLFLMHDRPIVRHVDDSIVRFMAGRESVLRRARGYAPLPVAFVGSESSCLAGYGAHLKSAVAVSLEGQILLSQHIGDLETLEAALAYDRVLADLAGLYGATPTAAACDLHPDYLSTHRAVASGLPVHPVQHHLAHVAACMADNQLRPPVLGVSWDGTGLGVDHTIWGGEFLRVDAGSWDRVAHLRRFPLPGGDAAVREPLRSAMGLLFDLAGRLDRDSPEGRLVARARQRIDAAIGERESGLLAQALSRSANTPLTSSAGRLFDAVSALLGVCAHSRFEGDAAMRLEFACDPLDEEIALAPMGIVRPADAAALLDWSPLIVSLLAESESGRSVGSIARAFHAALACGIADVCEAEGLERVALTGGCFQNKTLLELAVSELRSRGLQPYWHQRIPTNDAGIAVGQLAWIMDYST